MDDDIAPWEPDSFDQDELFDAWDAVDRDAAALLGHYCAEVLAEPPPQPDLPTAASALRKGIETSQPAYAQVRRAVGWADLPDLDDEALWVSAVAATISPPLDAGMDVEELSAIAATQHADWFGMVVGLVRRGAGASFDPDSVLRDIDELTGVTEDYVDDGGAVVGHTVTVLAPLWSALGILDDEETLTPLGRWGLPRALLRCWETGDADDGPGGDDPDTELDQAALDLVVRLLAERPRTIPDLRRELARHSVFVGPERLERALDWRVAGHALADGRYVHVPSMAEGVCLTHRMTEEEVALGIVEGEVDLALFAFLADEPVSLASGGQLRARYAMHREPLPHGCFTGLVGPDGWLPDVSTGDLVVLRYAGGEIHVDRLAAEPTGDVHTVQAFLRVADEAADRDAAEPDPDGPGVAMYDVVLELLRDQPSALSSPQPPLSDLLDATDLETSHGYLGLPGTPWGADPEWMSDLDRLTLSRWRRAARAFRRDGTAPSREELDQLASGMAGLALALMADDVTAEPGLESLLVGIEPESGRSAAGAMYLRARAAEGRQDLAAQTELLQAVLELDPGHHEAAVDLAELRAVAGDAHAAYRLYRAAGLPESSDEIRRLRRFLSPPEGETGRNRPCPCGSGRKYKLCHGRSARHPLGARSEWLWLKAVTYAQRGRHRETLLSWAQRLSGEDRQHRTTVSLAVAGDVVHDAALVDGGMLADFLDVHATLLPDDERELARRWLGSPRRLMEVQQVRPMRGIELRDLVTGETFDLPDRAMARRLSVKDVILGRPLDDGNGALCVLTDPMVLPRLTRGPLLEILRRGGSGEEVLEFLPHGGRPRAVTNTEGHEIVLCTSRYQLSDSDRAWAALASGDDADDDAGEDAEDARIVIGADRPGGGRTVRGTFTRAGDRVVVEANSVERSRELQARLLDADSAARLLDESSRPFSVDDLPSEQPAPSEQQPAPSELPLSMDELPADFVESLVLSYEEDWLTQPVPALRGLSPKEAAGDDQVRPELEALLDDFDWTNRRSPSPFAMDVRRLRESLGLA